VKRRRSHSNIYFDSNTLTTTSTSRVRCIQVLPRYITPIYITGT